ncbi:esterase-like activity of phytase family protein [Jannaschia sp. LMIT008]|uniref:esterase-like activity of phytase family protein n=1 Tax=Jannaschia maritima TaxID=3032585 RepID=UPI002811B059|nr:esterase-like activity of phytase family protein [Jannaschia sp. LMIT008]
MNKLLLGASALALTAGTALAQDMAFDRIASFPVTENLPEGTDSATETSPEIVAATADGMTLVYTDSPLGAVGFVDIADPAAPAGLGAMMLVGGEPTSVAIAGGFALVGVNTSESFTQPSGHLIAVTIDGMSEAARCPLPGQPDSVAVAPDLSFLAVAIENERDEDLGNGRVGQMPGGSVWMVDLTPDGLPDCGTARTADITGLAEVAPEDPEPEYVDINAEGEVVVTLQENNHIVVLSSAGEVLSHFSAGSVTLEGVDTAEEGALTFDDTLEDVVREPDAVTWIDDTHFATANEGDMDGGSRGWTIFSQDGEVVYESGLSFEYAVAEIGHYPEARSGNKGVEPESVTFAEYGGVPMLFVGSERGSVVGVYDVTDPAAPVLTQLLPSGVGPEGYATLPERGLLVSANEADLIEDGGARAHLMVFEMQDGAPSYPHLTSAGLTEDGRPVGWGALGALTTANGLLYAANDSFYGMQPSIFEIDVSETPARITAVTRITRNGAPAQLLDIEGIAADGEGGFWLASEGRSDRLIPHALYHVDGEGEIQDYVPLPEDLLDVEIRFGMEGVTLVDGTLYAILQREWQDDAENTVKLLAYDLETEEWSAAAYPKAAPEGPGWIGLSEVVAHGGHLYFIERDNQIGQAARRKVITRVALEGLRTAPLGGSAPLLEVEEVRDLIPDLASTGGYVVDKPEGLTFLEGEMWLVTDNDGVDDSSGETLLLNLGAP